MNGDRIDSFGLAPERPMLYCSVNLRHAQNATLILSSVWAQMTERGTEDTYHITHPCDECGYKLYGFARWELMKAHARLENEVWELGSF